MILKKVIIASGAPSDRGFNQGLQEGIRRLRLAMVGVKGNQNVILFCKTMGRLSENDRARGGILVVQPRSELSGTGGELNHAIGFHVGKSLKRGIKGGDTRAVNRRVGIGALLCGIQHGNKLLRCGSWHRCVSFLVRFLGSSWPLQAETW